MLLLTTLALAQATAVSPDYAGNCQSPHWSPDGTFLSWEVNYHEKKTIELYVATYGTDMPLRKVTPVNRGASTMTAGFDVSSGQSVVHEIAFSPPAYKKFVYAASGATQDYDIYLDGGGAIAAAPGADGNAAWSPDGKKIVFTSARTGQGDLYLLEVAHLETPPLKLTGDADSSELDAAWSPDSMRLVLVGHTQKGDNLYLIDNVDFPAPRAFTNWEHSQTRPSWSPDGTMIAFYSNHTDIHRVDLYMAPIAGTPTLVATDVVPNEGGPAWTPDSKHLVYVKHDDERFNPVYAAPIRQPSQAAVVPTGTVGNGDLSVVRRADGKVWIAVAAQGRTGDKVRDFKRVYAMPLGALP
jgi:Tol biopolymer transport system component